MHNSVWETVLDAMEEETKREDTEEERLNLKKDITKNIGVKNLIKPAYI